jgi:hypothetical protein
MDSIARLSELTQRFLVERPKELERTSGILTLASFWCEMLPNAVQIRTTVGV